jgi:pyroglutamyl-peptidase
VLPVDYARVGDVLAPHLSPSRRGVILLGVAIGRSAVSLERVAINFRDGARPDNAGFAPTNPEIVAGGPAAYFATLPLEAARDRIADAGINVEISLTAGAYLCNASFYLARHALDARGTPCVFVHLPPTPDLACGATPMSLTDEVRAIGEVLDSL